jgi:hypothetical protein
MRKFLLAIATALLLAACAADTISPGSGRSRQSCCGDELWQYQVY